MTPRDQSRGVAIRASRAHQNGHDDSAMTPRLAQCNCVVVRSAPFLQCFLCGVVRLCGVGRGVGRVVSQSVLAGHTKNGSTTPRRLRDDSATCSVQLCGCSFCTIFCNVFCVESCDSAESVAESVAWCPNPC